MEHLNDHLAHSLCLQVRLFEAQFHDLKASRNMVSVSIRRWMSSVLIRGKFEGIRKQVRVRFAPSPTGHLHLGGLRTALYNFLFAKHHKGCFILRIEDTDRARLVPGSVGSIERILEHYVLHYDEGPRKSGPYGPYQQSERLVLYKNAVDQLIESGHAYRVFLFRRREFHSADEIFGSVDQCIDESDMVLLKSDGFPTYHLANIVDDRAMHISHVIRGMEWLSSTGKQCASVKKAFGWPTPKWLHLPLITRDGKKKLSKRDKDAFVDFYEQRARCTPESRFEFTDRIIADSTPAAIEHDLPSIQVPDDVYLKKVLSFLKANEESFAFLSSLTKGDFRWFLTKPMAAERLLSVTDRETALETLTYLQECESLDVDALKMVAEQHGWEYTKLLAVIRVTLIDNTKGPPIKELVSFFGIEECHKRFSDMISFLHSSKEAVLAANK
ncbi:putative glutamate--tRNA ligase [Ostertagia ostertagi]